MPSASELHPISYGVRSASPRLSEKRTNRFIHRMTGPSGPDREPPTTHYRHVHHLLDERRVGMTLPQELVDDILVYLQHDKQALRNCSLVAKSWAHPSQKLLFASIYLTPKIYETRLENASPMSTEVLRHVRTLTCRGFFPFGIPHSDYFRSLHHLQHLTLREIREIGPDTPNLFLAFHDTLSSLFLDWVHLTWSTFVGLIDCFPNLRGLHFHRSSLKTDHSPVPPLSRLLRGKLYLLVFVESDLSTFSRGIAGLELEYDQLEIIYTHSDPSHVQHILSACKKTLTWLRLVLRCCKQY